MSVKDQKKENKNKTKQNNVGEIEKMCQMSEKERTIENTVRVFFIFNEIPCSLCNKVLPESAKVSNS